MLKVLFFSILGAFAQSGALKIQLDGVKAKQNGPILCALFRSDHGFPMQPEAALEIQLAYKAADKWECSYYNLRAGQYAVSVIHDQNRDGKMSTNKLGMPLEGWATSNNVVPGMRPPNFKESSVHVDGNQHELSLKMHY